MESGVVSSIADRRIILGVSGGIAAYKAVEICRRLVEAGAIVTPVLTKSAQNFVGKATFRALGSAEVVVDLWSNLDPIPHTTLGRSTDLVVVVPATANLIGKYAAGLADDALSTILIATGAPVVICAAMHTEMWQHPSVIQNTATLRDRGVIVVNPQVGSLAGGNQGIGRLADTDTILTAIYACLSKAISDDFGQTSSRLTLKGRRLLLTLGGTREAIDPVRFIGNRSSGLQGIAILNAASRLGATGIVVSTIGIEDSHGFEVISVESATEMEAAVLDNLRSVDILIMCAAVSDYRVANISLGKIKKSGELVHLDLIENPDILLQATQLATREDLSLISVGFAAETDQPLENAKIKLKRKGVDLLVVNDVSEPGAGFGGDTNAVWILAPNVSESRIELTSKEVIAQEILERVVALIDK